MPSKSVTNDWDILVSYATGDKLNNLLKDAWAGPLGTNEIEHTDDEYGFKIKLSKPRLEFQGDSMKASLHVDLAGSFWSNDWDGDNSGDHEKTTWKFEDYDYGFSITAPINVVTGDQVKHEGNNVFQFDDTKTDTHHIVLHMQNQELDWKSKPPTDSNGKKGSPIAKKAVDQVEKYIRNPTNIRWLDITLGEVNNTPNAQSDLAALFQPQSFRLATRSGALDIFIQTKGGYQQGSKNPTFEVKGSPLENTTYNGAIILSHRLFQDKYLIPQIQKHCSKLAKDGNGNGRVTSKEVDSGLQLELVFDKVQTLSAGGGSMGFLSEEAADEIELKFSDYPVKLDIVNKLDAMPQAKWEWQHSFEVHWHITSYDMTRETRADFSRTINAEIGDNTSDIATLNDNKLDFNFEFKKEFQPTMTIPNDVPNTYKNIKVELDVFKFGLDEIRYFASTNVFAPGRHFIDLKTVRSPHDLFVMGELKTTLS